MREPSGRLREDLLANGPELLSGGQVPRFEEVAELVGVSRATLYYYFSGQDDLLAFLLRAHVAAGAEVIERADPGADQPPTQRLRLVLSAVVTYLAERPGVCAGLLGAAASRNQMQDVLDRNDQLVARPLRELLHAGVEVGEFDVGDRHDAVGVLLGGMLLAVLAADGADGRTLDEDGRTALVDQLLGGVLTG